MKNQLALASPAGHPLVPVCRCRDGKVHGAENRWHGLAKDPERGPRQIYRPQGDVRPLRQLHHGHYGLLDAASVRAPECASCDEKAFAAVTAYQLPECWRDWKGPDYGNQGGQTTQWALKNVDPWLKRLNPEVALILFGTNDLHSIETEEYERNLKAVVQKCLENGTFVILNTIPPRHGMDKKTADFVGAPAVSQRRPAPL